MPSDTHTEKRYLFYVTLSYSFGVLRPIEKVIKASGGQVAWFIPNGSEAEKFLTHDDMRLPDVNAVMAYQSDAVLAPGNYIPHFFPGIKVQVFHGFDSGKKNKFNVRGFFDLYCTQGPNITQAFTDISDGTYDIVETGWSKLDPLFFPSEEAEQYRSASPVILYAPTFSPKLTSTQALYPYIKQLSEQRDWQWLIKLHPKATQAEVDLYKALAGDRVKFIETGDIIPLLQAADVILSDTSSVLAEFALQQKVVVAFNNRRPDTWMLNFTKADKLQEQLEVALARPDTLMAKISDHCHAIHPQSDGRSSERVLAAINGLIDKGTGHLKAKPLNIVRRLKMRKKLNYWRFW